MAGMTWRTTGDVVEFLDAAGAYLRQERARNTVLLTVTEQLRVNSARETAAEAGPADAGPADAGPADAGPADPAGRPLFGWWAGDGGAAAGAFMHTPPSPLLLSGVPAEAAAGLAATLAGRPLNAVNAYPEAARSFAAAWSAIAGCQPTYLLSMRLYRLAELTWPDPVPEGESRVAADADVPLLAGWFAAFARETHNEAEAGGYDAVVRDRLGYGGLLIWQAGGRPVAMAAATRQVAGMVRIGPVYTPPEFRGHGYASAVTAELSLRAREAGAAEVLLYTDLDNPVTNSIYQRIGYRGVEDRVVLTFSTPGTTSR
jgi:GNAT superfamily N-acetyltransferase